MFYNTGKDLANALGEDLVELESWNLGRSGGTRTDWTRIDGTRLEPESKLDSELNLFNMAAMSRGSEYNFIRKISTETS